jgi:catechol 2,3-dioxygenase-like lactoylglutathione lyase family enzyme
MPTRSSEKPNTDLKPRLHAAYPQLFVCDMERAIVFYRDRLGFTVEYLYGEPPCYGLVSRDGVGLNLRHVDAPVFDPSSRDREMLLSANIPVEGIAGLFRDFESAHIDFAQRLQHQPWGTDDFVVRDPDGNLLCFASVA